MIWRASDGSLFSVNLQLDPTFSREEPGTVSETVYPVSARTIVDEGWVTLKGFNAEEGKYELSAAGRAMTELFCECKPRWGDRRDAKEFALLSGIDPATTAKVDWPKERLLCTKCWRVTKCEGKFFKHPHEANRYIWGVGPICQRHVENPNRR